MDLGIAAGTQSSGQIKEKPGRLINDKVKKAGGRGAHGWQHDRRSMLISFGGNRQFSQCLNADRCKTESPNFYLGLSDC